MPVISAILPGYGRHLCACCSALAACLLALAGVARAEYIQAGGTDIVVSGYSVPSFADWNHAGV
ncbi:MAG: hypothetical protein ABIG68_11585, partial [Acidobacteriota bacterium]